MNPFCIFRMTPSKNKNYKRKTASGYKPLPFLQTSIERRCAVIPHSQMLIRICPRALTPQQNTNAQRPLYTSQFLFVFTREFVAVRRHHGRSVSSTEESRGRETEREKRKTEKEKEKKKKEMKMSIGNSL